MIVKNKFNNRLKLIIANMLQYKSVWIGILIFLISLVFRLWHIEATTEFLGDQGSALVVIKEAFDRGEIPLHGPATSTGQFPGPFYYYLIAPVLILTNFNPAAPAIFFGILGSATAVIIFLIGRQLWGIAVAVVISLIYATSPVLISWDRNMWNPTAIPFLTTVVIWLFFLYIHKPRHIWLYLLGICLGALVQLHFSTAFTVFFMFASLGLVLYLQIRQRYYRKWKYFLVQLLILFVGFITILAPYLLYESGKNWSDIKSIISMYLFNPADKPRLVFFGWGDIVVKIFSFIIPTDHKAFIFSASLVICFLAGLKKTARSFWLLVWLGAAAIYVKLTGIELHTHYLIFLLPAPFLILGQSFSYLRNKLKITAVLIAGLIWIFINIIVYAQNYSQLKDIGRTGETVDLIKKNSAGGSFSFTLISSRSFSDYHYRAIFDLRQIKPADIYGRDYSGLYLICEKFPCPHPKDISGKNEIEVMCFDHHCLISYPKLDLTKFEYRDFYILDEAVIYEFEHK